MKNKRPSVFKIIIYFLIGLLASIFGLITGGLWLWFKVKDFRKYKVIALVLGVLINLGLQLIVGPEMNRRFTANFYSSNPELRKIAGDLTAKYPGSQLDLNISPNTIISGPDGTKKYNVLTISMVPNGSVGETIYSDIANLVCMDLASSGKSYDVVKVELIKPGIVQLKTNINGTCENWLGGKPFKSVLP